MKLKFVITSVISIAAFVGIASAQQVEIFDASFNGGIFVGLTPVSPTSGLVSDPNVNALAGRTIRLRIASTNNSGILVQWGRPWSPSGCSATSPFMLVSTTYGRGTYSVRLETNEVLAATDPTWKGTCRILSVKLSDGSEHIGRIFFE